MKEKSTIVLVDDERNILQSLGMALENEGYKVRTYNEGQAALDVDGIGTFGSSGEQKPVPIASVAKVMTAYVILKEHPLKAGADGAKIPVDAKA